MNAPLTPEVGVADDIWRTKYRAAGEDDIAATQRRVARALTEVGPEDQARRAAGAWFITGGQILAAAGTNRAVTLFNGFGMGPIEDLVRAPSAHG